MTFQRLGAAEQLEHQITRQKVPEQEHQTAHPPGRELQTQELVPMNRTDHQKAQGLVLQTSLLQVLEPELQTIRQRELEPGLRISHRMVQGLARRMERGPERQTVQGLVHRIRMVQGPQMVLVRGLRNRQSHLERGLERRMAQVLESYRITLQSVRELEHQIRQILQRHFDCQRLCYPGCSLQIATPRRTSIHMQA